MYTPFVCFALAGMFAANPSPADGPQWLKDYEAARQKSVSANKPLAVFIGAGKQGWEEVSEDGRLDKDVLHILSADYVCVYVDMKLPAGRKLAEAFEVSDGPGLVISNRQASLQAFRHEGNLSNEELESYLRRFADAKLVVQRTETKPPPAPASTYREPVTPVNYAPAYNYTPAYYNAPANFSSVRC